MFRNLQIDIQNFSFQIHYSNIIIKFSYHLLGKGSAFAKIISTTSFLGRAVKMTMSAENKLKREKLILTSLIYKDLNHFKDILGSLKDHHGSYGISFDQFI
jgi:hypothetical protein